MNIIIITKNILQTFFIVICIYSYLCGFDMLASQ